MAVDCSFRSRTVPDIAGPCFDKGHVFPALYTCRRAPPRPYSPILAPIPNTPPPILHTQVWEYGSRPTFRGQENVLKEQPRTILLHDNWIKGLKSKKQQYCFYDRRRLSCNYSERPVSAMDWDVQEDGSD